jgi:DNA repair protein RadC
MSEALATLVGEAAAEYLLANGSLRDLVTMSVAELAQAPGVGPAKARKVRAAFCLARELLGEQAPPDKVRGPADAAKALGLDVGLLPHEELRAVYLNQRRRVLGVLTLTRGNDAFTIVDPRQVYRPAVRLGARAVVLGHNHPSGDPEPSHQDISATDRVERAGRVLGIALVDHIIIAGARWTSLAERGHLTSATPSVYTTGVS